MASMRVSSHLKAGVSLNESISSSRQDKLDLRVSSPASEPLFFESKAKTSDIQKTLFDGWVLKQTKYFVKDKQGNIKKPIEERSDIYGFSVIDKKGELFGPNSKCYLLYAPSNDYKSFHWAIINKEVVDNDDTGDPDVYQLVQRVKRSIKDYKIQYEHDLRSNQGLIDELCKYFAESKSAFIQQFTLDLFRRPSIPHPLHTPVVPKPSGINNYHISITLQENDKSFSLPVISSYRLDSKNSLTVSQYKQIAIGRVNELMNNHKKHSDGQGDRFLSDSSFLTFSEYKNISIMDATGQKLSDQTILVPDQKYRLDIYRKKEIQDLDSETVVITTCWDRGGVLSYTDRTGPISNESEHIEIYKRAQNKEAWDYFRLYGINEHYDPDWSKGQLYDNVVFVDDTMLFNALHNALSMKGVRNPEVVAKQQISKRKEMLQVKLGSDCIFKTTQVPYCEGTTEKGADIIKGYIYSYSVLPDFLGFAKKLAALEKKYGVLYFLSHSSDQADEFESQINTINKHILEYNNRMRTPGVKEEDLCPLIKKPPFYIQIVTQQNYNEKIRLASFIYPNEAYTKDSTIIYQVPEFMNNAFTGKQGLRLVQNYMLQQRHPGAAIINWVFDDGQSIVDLVNLESRNIAIHVGPEQSPSQAIMALYRLAAPKMRSSQPLSTGLVFSSLQSQKKAEADLIKTVLSLIYDLMQHVLKHNIIFIPRVRDPYDVVAYFLSELLGACRSNQDYQKFHKAYQTKEEGDDSSLLGFDRYISDSKLIPLVKQNPTYADKLKNILEREDSHIELIKLATFDLSKPERWEDSTSLAHLVAPAPK